MNHLSTWGRRMTEYRWCFPKGSLGEAGNLLNPSRSRCYLHADSGCEAGGRPAIRTTLGRTSRHEVRMSAVNRELGKRRYGLQALRRLEPQWPKTWVKRSKRYTQTTMPILATLDAGTRKRKHIIIALPHRKLVICPNAWWLLVSIGSY